MHGEHNRSMSEGLTFGGKEEALEICKAIKNQKSKIKNQKSKSKSKCTQKFIQMICYEIDVSQKWYIVK